MTFGPDQQAKLKAYCEHRMEQLGQYVTVLEYFGALDAIRNYFRGLRLICDEMDSKINDDETKKSNAYWLLRSNDCWLFSDDVWAIINGLEPPLPDDIFAIREYKAEIERKRREEQERVKQEARAREAAETLKRRAAEDAERRRVRREQLAGDLGIDVEVLEKLREAGGKRNGAV